MPIAHVSLPVSSLPASKAFYEAALKPLNYSVFMSLESSAGFAPKYDGPDFWIHQCSIEQAKEDSEKRGVQKTHVAFKGKSRKQVGEFYEAALKVGAKDNGKPGDRAYVKGYYAAYVLDLDGNNVECVYFQPLWLSALQWAPGVVGAVVVGGLGWWAGGRGKA